MDEKKKNSLMAIIDTLVDAIIPGPGLLEHDTDEKVEEERKRYEKLAKENPYVE